MSEFDRFCTFYGHSYARLDSGQSIYRMDRKSNATLESWLSMLFCNGLRERLDMLNKLFVDHFIQTVAFRKTTKKLIKRWQTEIICVQYSILHHIGFDGNKSDY